MTNIPSIHTSPEEANLASAAVIGALYITFGEDPIEWEKMDAPARQVIDQLQDIRSRLEYFLDPWEAEMDFFSISVVEAKLMRICFRIFSNAYPDLSHQELQKLFLDIEGQSLKGKKLLQGLRKMDARLLSFIRDEAGGGHSDQREE